LFHNLAGRDTLLGRRLLPARDLGQTSDQENCQVRSQDSPLNGVPAGPIPRWPRHRILDCSQLLEPRARCTFASLVFSTVQAATVEIAADDVHIIPPPHRLAKLRRQVGKHFDIHARRTGGTAATAGVGYVERLQSPDHPSWLRRPLSCTCTSSRRK
jgi:hypothetical protein